MTFRPTRAVVDLAALKHNYNEVSKRIPKGCGILAMVKADAYGHGAVPVAKALENFKVTSLGVATIEEGIEIRKAGVKTKVLVMGGLMGQGKEAAEALLEHCLTPVIHSAGVIDILETLRGSNGQPIYVHLKIDSGMSRLGVTPQALPHVLDRLKSASHVKLEGVMTHLAWRQDSEYTKQQVQIFKEAGGVIQKKLGKIPVWHLANSAAVIEGGPLIQQSLDHPDPSGCWVRPGIMLYGIPPYPEFSSKVFLKPAMSLVSQVALIKTVPAKTKISYNCTFTTKRSSRIGVVPIGYADGYPWSVSNRGEVLVEGGRVPILGRVTMDMVMIDLTLCPQAHVGSEVVLLGKQGEKEISADDLAQWAGTIAYEIVCRVSKRMSRIYRE